MNFSSHNSLTFQLAALKLSINLSPVKVTCWNKWSHSVTLWKQLNVCNNFYSYSLVYLLYIIKAIDTVVTITIDNRLHNRLQPHIHVCFILKKKFTSQSTASDLSCSHLHLTSQSSQSSHCQVSYPNLTWLTPGSTQSPPP